MNGYVAYDFHHCSLTGWINGAESVRVSYDGAVLAELTSFGAPTGDLAERVPGAGTFQARLDLGFTALDVVSRRLQVTAHAAGQPPFPLKVTAARHRELTELAVIELLEQLSAKEREHLWNRAASGGVLIPTLPPGRSVVVHAGLPKTGTSAVQSWLHAHRELLAERGVSYPDHDLDSNGVSSGNVMALAEPDRKGAWRVSERAVGQTLGAFVDSGKDTLLLSSELFGPVVPDLAAVLPHGTRFIIYVRDPLELLESGYNQSVKRTRTTRVFEVPADLRGGWLGPSEADLERILGSAPSGISLDVRPYHPDLFEGGSVVADLLWAADLPVGPEVVGPDESRARVNTSYTLPALEFKRVVNHLPVGRALDRALDYLLQSYPDGATDYSFIEPTDYARLREQADAYLASLSVGFGLAGLERLRTVLRGQGSRRPHLPQRATTQELGAVARFVRQRDPALHAGLAETLVANPHVDLPYPEVRDLLV